MNKNDSYAQVANQSDLMRVQLDGTGLLQEKVYIIDATRAMLCVIRSSKYIVKDLRMYQLEENFHCGI